MKKKPSAFHKLASQDHLSFHLKDFFTSTPKYKRKTVGIDGVSLSHIGKRNTDFIRDLSRDLKNINTSAQNSYKHQPLSIFPIEKPNSDNFRVICIPTVRDRLVQKSILGILRESDLTFETPISYGGSSERSVKKAVKNALLLRKRFPWIYKTDISSFFDRIPRKEMKELVKRKIKLRSLHKVFFQAIDAEITDNLTEQESKIVISNGIKKGIGLRQGLPISPMLANLYMQEFDKSVVKNNFTAIRYVDDLIFFCKSKEECLNAHKFCVSNLENIGLNVPPLENRSKSVIYDPDTDAEFLGLLIVKSENGYSLNISDSQISRTYNKFKEYCDIDKNLEQGIQFSKLSSKLESIVSSYKGHYSEADNYEWFEGKLHSWKAKVYRKLISSNLKVDIESLDFKTKLFFHLINDINLKT